MHGSVAGVVANGVIVPNLPLPEGTKVEFTVVGPEKSGSKFGSALEFLESLPSGPSPRCFSTWEEYERHLKEEKNSWDR